MAYARRCRSAMLTLGFSIAAVGGRFSAGSLPIARTLSGPTAIYAISDMHTDRAENMAWVRSRAHYPADARTSCCVVAGDVSHRLDVLEETLGHLCDAFARVFFVPGNHELWIRPSDAAGPGGLLQDSLAKSDAIATLCAELGVSTAPELVGGVVIVPLLSWYDRSLSMPDVPSLPLKLWSDFSRCAWPVDRFGRAPARTLPTSAFSAAAATRDAAIAAYFLAENELTVESASAAIAQLAELTRADTATPLGAAEPSPARPGRSVHADGPPGLPPLGGVLSFSHFLPASCCLPDWCEPEATAFDARWLSHGAGRKAALFAAVAGSSALDAQLRALTAGERMAVPHVHVFGHSHRPKDVRVRGVRYVHNPVGKGSERDWGMLPAPSFKPLWDGSGRALPAQRPVIRYWEENWRETGRVPGRQTATKRRLDSRH